MTAQDYPVDFGYGAQDGYYYGPKGIVGPYHRGNDRLTPVGTPIVIAGKTIGLTGATGLVGGPHLHNQAGTDQACQNTFDPTPLEFKPGVVVATGYGNQWGNYITVRVDGRFITYCHLSRIDVQPGLVLNEDMPLYPSIGDVSKMYDVGLGRQPYDYGNKRWIDPGAEGWTRVPFNIAMYGIFDSEEAQQRRRVQAEKNSIISQLQASDKLSKEQMTELQKQLTAKNKELAELQDKYNSNPDTALLNEGNGVAIFLEKLWNRIRGKK